MNVQAMKQGAIVGSFLGFLGFPMLTIGVLFYHLFQSKRMMLYYLTVSLLRWKALPHLLFRSSQTFYLYDGDFAVSFLIVAFLSAMKQKKQKVRRILLTFLC